MKFIEKIETEDTGGHVLVDYVYLKNGYIIGIAEDCVCVYNNEQYDLWKELPISTVWLP